MKNTIASLFLQDLPLFSVCLFGEALPSFEMSRNQELTLCLGCRIHLQKRLENLFFSSSSLKEILMYVFVLGHITTCMGGQLQHGCLMKKGL